MINDGRIRDTELDIASFRDYEGSIYSAMGLVSIFGGAIIEGFAWTKILAATENLQEIVYYVSNSPKDATLVLGGVVLLIGGLASRYHGWKESRDAQEKISGLENLA